MGNYWYGSSQPEAADSSWTFVSDPLLKKKNETKTAPDDKKKLSQFEIAVQIKTWMDNACTQFANFPYDQVVENDTPYDIDSLEVEFLKFYTNLSGGIPPDKYLFHSEVRKRCKRVIEAEYSDYDSYQGTLEEDDKALADYENSR